MDLIPVWIDGVGGLLLFLAVGVAAAIVGATQMFKKHRDKLGVERWVHLVDDVWFGEAGLYVIFAWGITVLILLAINIVASIN